MDSWVLGLATKRGKELGRGDRAAAGPRGKEPGQARSAAISPPGFLAPLPRLWNVSCELLPLTQAARTSHRRTEAYTWHVHVFLVLEWHPQVTLGDLMQAVFDMWFQSISSGGRMSLVTIYTEM